MIEDTPVLTPKVDKVLQIFTLKTREGFLLNDTITPGGKIIMESILGRQAPDDSGRKRIQLEAHTRYGKSLDIAAAVCIRSAMKKEPWAVVAPTKEKAQIIMDYAIQFIVSDPILSNCLIFDEGETIEMLKHHRSKDRITFKEGGEIRTFSAGLRSLTSGKGGDALMGFGSANVIEDEAYLIDDNTHSKVMRMLGDQTDNFLMKVGNPWNRGHAYLSRNDPAYFKMIFDYKQGLKEGRLSPEYVEEMKKEPNFSVLYECIPPEEDAMDQGGWMPLITENALRNALIIKDSLQPWGQRKLGVDVADQGADSTTIIIRHENFAELLFSMTNTGPNGAANQAGIIATEKRPQYIFIDRIGVGAGTFQTLSQSAATEDISVGVIAGERSPDPNFANLKAWLYWELKKWIEGGGKLVHHEKWMQLLTIKYRVTESKVEIMSKQEMRKRGLPSPDAPEALALTFSQVKQYHIPEDTPTTDSFNKEWNQRDAPVGGANAMYPDLGF